MPIANVFADEDSESEDDEERLGFGETEREREREQEGDDDGAVLGSDAGNIILYGTIAAILAAVGYSAFKIVTVRKRSNPKSQQP